MIVLYVFFPLTANEIERINNALIVLKNIIVYMVHMFNVYTFYIYHITEKYSEKNT